MMKLRRIHAKYADTLAELNKQLPEEKFIAVFGTSHTSGNCVRGDKISLEKSDFWTTHVGDVMGTPVINFSVSGNDNPNMIQQMIDFLLLPGSSNCIQVVCETRLAQPAFRISRDLLNDFTDLRRNAFEQQLTSGYDWNDPDITQVKYKRNTVDDKLMLRLPNSLLKMGFDYLKNYVTKLNPSQRYDIDPEVFDKIVEQIEQFDKHTIVTMKLVIEDYQQIKTMASLCKLRGVKFNWFCWDDHSLISNKDVDYRVVKRAFIQTSDIFDSEISGLEESAIRKFKDSINSTDVTKYKCECGHYTEEVHQFIADAVLESIGT